MALTQLTPTQKLRAVLLAELPKNITREWFRKLRKERAERIKEGRESLLAYNPGNFIDELERRFLDNKEDPARLIEEYDRRDTDFQREYGPTPHTAAYCCFKVCIAVAHNEEEEEKKRQERARRLLAKT